VGRETNQIGTNVLTPIRHHEPIDPAELRALFAGVHAQRNRKTVGILAGAFFVVVVGIAWVIARM
jgi:hypothetical protein